MTAEASGLLGKLGASKQGNPGKLHLGLQSGVPPGWVKGLR